MLQVAHKVWPYLLQQRDERLKDSDTHRLVYRRALEAIVRQIFRP
jgi:hypothetical protein